MSLFKPENNRGLRRIMNACKFSAQGFVATFKTEEAFRQEFYMGFVALPLSFWIAGSVVEWVLLILVYLLVLLVEIINSSIEATVDRFGGEHHQLSGKAKDAASAAVSIALLMAALTWGALLVSKWFS